MVITYSSSVVFIHVEIHSLEKKMFLLFCSPTVEVQNKFAAYLDVATPGRSPPRHDATGLRHFLELTLARVLRAHLFTVHFVCELALLSAQRPMIYLKFVSRPL
jgi:hypothetical protein